MFIVLAGDASADFVDPALPSIQLRLGAVVRLEAGINTVWTVPETLRKSTSRSDAAIPGLAPLSPEMPAA